jgi:hypothetical protein
MRDLRRAGNAKHSNEVERIKRAERISDAGQAEYGCRLPAAQR